MRSGYTLVTTLGLMILLSALVVGMNSVISGTLRKSSAVRNAANADFAAESALELGKAIVLGNVTLSTLDANRIRFDGTAIACEFAPEFKTILKITDVAGLVDLRFSSDQLLSALLRGTTSARVSDTLLAKVRGKANSGLYISAVDVLVASGLTHADAGNAGKFSTVHGRHFRLARDVTPPDLASMLTTAGIDVGGIFGASPSNKVFKVAASTLTQGKSLVESDALIAFEHSGNVRFLKLFEKRATRKLASSEAWVDYTRAPGGEGIWCTRV